MRSRNRCCSPIASQFSRKNPALLVVIAAALALTSCHHADIHQTLRAANFRAPESGPVLLAAYQPWFGRPGHINVGYNTQDSAVLERQITEARNLGIRGFVVNWYGPRKEFEDRSYGLMQQAASHTDFRVAIMYDEDNDDPGQATDKVVVDLQYAYDRYIGPHADATRSAYLRYDGHPVIFIFPKGGDTDWNRIRQLANTWEDPPLLIYQDVNTKYLGAFDGFYAWVQPGAAGWNTNGSNWGRDYLDAFYSRMTSKYPEKIAVGAAWPGFDDSRASWTRNRRMDARCGKTFEESLRLFRRYYNDKRPLPFLMIVTWNDYEEGTAIERGTVKCGAGGGSNSPATAQASP
jgi:hypothetical protein